MSDSTDRYAVIGNPIAHSRSPAIHAQFARQTGQRMCYDAVLCEIDRFAATVDAFRRGGGRGMNVTVPFKLEAFAYASERSARAQAAGAANTLLFDGDRVHADNTDGAGLVHDLSGRLALRLDGARLLVLGAGGAARGVLQPLLQAGVERILVVNRSRDKALALQQPRVQGAGFDELSAGGERFDIVINATSSALADAPLPVPASCLEHAALAYDMMYGRAPSRFLQQALQAGCPRVSDGLGMLVEQAAESFLLWRGVRPQTGQVFAQIRAQLDAGG